MTRFARPQIHTAYLELLEPLAAIEQHAAALGLHLNLHVAFVKRQYGPTLVEVKIQPAQGQGEQDDGSDDELLHTPDLSGCSS